MGMTIDEAIEELQRQIVSLTEHGNINKQTQSLEKAVEVMRKYQKIQEVMDSRADDDAKSNSKALGEIEVIMYGDNN